jgi:hypothetical protein
MAKILCPEMTRTRLSEYEDACAWPHRRSHSEYWGPHGDIMSDRQRDLQLQSAVGVIGGVANHLHECLMSHHTCDVGAQPLSASKWALKYTWMLTLGEDVWR